VTYDAYLAMLAVPRPTRPRTRRARQQKSARLLRPAQNKIESPAADPQLNGTSVLGYPLANVRGLGGLVVL